MRRTAASALISVLLITTTVGNLLISLGKANPYLYDEEKDEVAPPSNISPPTVTILYPRKNSTIIGSNVTLTFCLRFVAPTLPELMTYSLELDAVYYEASWLPNKTDLDIEQVRNSIPHDRFFSEENLALWHTYWAIKGYEFSHNFSVNLEGVPEGFQRLKVSAVLLCCRQTRLDTSRYPTIYYGYYRLIGSSKISLSVDSVSVLSPKNETYDSSGVPLLFEAPESVKEISYSLDGRDRIAVSGNTSLTGLPSGRHNVTLYAVDEAGNVGVIRTVFFSTLEPFPVVPLAAASAAAIFAGLGLLVYWKKRRRELL